MSLIFCYIPKITLQTITRFLWHLFGLVAVSVCHRFDSPAVGVSPLWLVAVLTIPRSVKLVYKYSVHCVP